VYGFEAGANLYFSKPARNPDLAERAAFCWAGVLPKGPVAYSPILESGPGVFGRRKTLVLKTRWLEIGAGIKAAGQS